MAYTPTSIQALTQEPINTYTGTGSAPGGYQYIDGGQASMMPPTIPTVAPAPAPTITPAPVVAPTAPAPEPTIADTLQGIKDQALKVQAQLNQRQMLENLSYDQSVNPYAEAIKPIDERAIQRNQMRLFQKEIDATNRVYQDILNQERLAGQGRLGTQTAMSARAGLLGSDFGEANRQNQLAANLQNERAIENERLAKIGTIMGTMRKAVADEIANKRLARQQDAETYVKYLASEKDRKASNARLAAQALIDSGLDINTLRPEELDAIGKEAKLSAADILREYNQMKAEGEAAGLETRKTEAEIAKIEADIAAGKLIKLGEGDMLYDPETGETFKNPKTKAPGTGGDGVSEIKLTPENKRTLLGGGWTEGEISELEKGVREYGLNEVISGEKAAGASAAKIKALQTVYGSEAGDTTQFLTKDYFKQLFTTDQLEKAAAEAGFGDLGVGVFNLKDVNTDEYLTYIEGVINSYRLAGYNDQEILKMMKK